MKGRAFSDMVRVVWLVAAPIVAANVCGSSYKEVVLVTPLSLVFYVAGSAAVAHLVSAEGSARCLHPYWMNPVLFFVEKLGLSSVVAAGLHVMMRSIGRGRRRAFVTFKYFAKERTEISQKNAVSRSAMDLSQFDLLRANLRANHLFFIRHRTSSFTRSWKVTS